MALSLDNDDSLGRQPGNFASLMPGESRIRDVARREAIRETITVLKALRRHAVNISYADLAEQAQWASRPWWRRVIDFILRKQPPYRALDPMEILTTAVELTLKEME